MASRVPTIDFAGLNRHPHPQPAPDNFSRTDGRDHRLKQDLKNVSTIVSCVVEHGGDPRLEARPYPCDEAREPIPLSELRVYSNTHAWLNNILCFCEFMYGARRAVRVIEPRYGEYAGDIVLGCSMWTKEGKAAKGGQEFCLYWLNLTKLCASDGFEAALQLQVYPVLEHAYIGKARNTSNHNIRRILGMSGGPSSSQASGSPSSSQGSMTTHLGTGPRALAAALSRQQSLTSNDSTVIIPADPEERKAQAKPKRKLFPQTSRAAAASKSLPKQRVMGAKVPAPLLPAPILDISDDEAAGAPPPCAQPSKRQMKLAGGLTPPTAPIAARKAPIAARKRGATNDAEVIVISDDDNVGGGPSASRPVKSLFKKTIAKSSKRMRVGHMSTMGGGAAPRQVSSEGGHGMGTSSGTVSEAAPSSGPTLYTVGGGPSGSPGTVFAAFTGMKGEIFYELAGKE